MERPVNIRQLEDPDMDGRVILKWMCKKCAVKLLPTFVWPRTGDKFKALLNTEMNFDFHEKRRIS